MEQKQDTLQQKLETLQTENDKLKKELDEYKKKEATSFQSETRQHPPDFWEVIKDKCISDPEYIKRLVKNKTLTVFDTNSLKQTLLMFAAKYGSYEIAQLCINSDANINAKDNRGRTALDFSRKYGYYHVEQLLLFSQMNVNVGNEIKNTANIIHKQNGITDNILHELSLIGQQSKQLFENILLELMINIINKRLSFSDNLLNLCWVIISRNNKPLSSDLWKSLSSTCQSIIQNGNKRDWTWLKSCVIPSTVWFQDIGFMDIQNTEQKTQETYTDTKAHKAHYLYFELLKLVEMEAENQLNKLEQDLNELANQNRNNWNKLTKWDIPNEYDIVRQDVIPNGIVSRFTYQQLSESSGTTFNSPKFYDYNQYLSQLVLLAQIVDDEFQKSIQDMFNIDMVTHESVLEFNNYGNNIDEKDNIGNGKIIYMRGPVKLVDRARSKVQNDYTDQEYPQSACILDCNRCALVFNDISTLLRALELFVNKVKYYQSGNIIGIVREKNGFIEYVKNTQYADIKLNVLINGKHNNIIAEVQFLLKTMKEFKDKAHNLYAIQRQKEAIQSSVTKILPMLLDEDKELFIAGNRGNVKRLCELMVINNKSIQDIMKVDKETGNTILHRICSLGHNKAFLFLKSIISKELFIKYALTANASDQKPVEYSVRHSQLTIAKNLFDIEEIKKHYKKKNELFRLCYWLFRNQNDVLIDYIFNILNITNNDMKEMMSYKYQTNEEFRGKSGRILYDRETILCRLVYESPVSQLLKLVSIIGEKEFIKNVFIDDDFAMNAFEAAVFRENRMKMIEYILSFKEIKDKYINDNNLLFRLIYWLFVKCGNKKSINYILSELSISNDKIRELITYKYPEHDASKTYGSDAYKYEYYSIVASIVSEGKFDALKHLVALIGENGFFHSVFMKDGWNKNTLQNGIEKNRLDFMEYILTVKDIQNKCVDDKDELHSIISTLNANYNETMAVYIVNVLHLTQTKLNDLKIYKDINITKILNICDK